jgi:REP element-mobilizing transposase RayT
VKRHVALADASGYDGDVNDPLAYFLTISTYGVWLPGDARGWVEYRHGWQLPDPVLELESKALMTEDACLLSPSDRIIVQQQLEETCLHRGWTLHAANCRSNHLHAVIGAVDTHPTKIRRDIKSWCTRRLRERSNPDRENWWAERGSMRWIFNDDSLERVVLYVNDVQDRKGRDR